MGSKFANMSMTRKLMLVMVVMGLLPALIISFISSYEATVLLEEQAINNLVAVRESRKSGIERYLNRINDQVTVMAAQGNIVSAMKAFKRDFNQYINQSSDFSLGQARRSVSGYYKNEFGKEFKKQNDKDANIDPILRSLSPTTLALQQDYISNNQHPLGSKDTLEQAGGRESYHDNHKKLPMKMRESNKHWMCVPQTS